LGATVDRVDVVELKDSVYFADLQLRRDKQTYHVSTRPSDAIALAVRAGAQVFVSSQVLADAGIEFSEESEEDEIERFREMLEDVTIEDFLPGEESPG
jgi:hypothetical protein